MSLKSHLKRLMEDRARLGRDEARTLMQSILHGEAVEIEIAAVLGALAARGETPQEIAGFVDALRSAVTTLPLTDAERDNLVDTCGTGGDAGGTFNISTAAALVAAAAGANVAKHGNRAVTSKCGSADVLEALGIPVTLSPHQATESLRRHNFCFLLAPGYHSAMRAVMPTRRALAVPTVFNLLGPLANPAGARRQVMGVYGAAQAELAAEAMVLLGVSRAYVVHGDAGDATGIDEFSISGPSQVAEVLHGAVRLASVSPEDASLRTLPPGQLQGGDAQENAAILRRIFSGTPGPHRDVVVLNAAAVLVVAGLAPTLPEAVHLAQQTIDRGAVTHLIQNLASNQP